MSKILLEVNQVCSLNCEYCFYRDYGRDNNYFFSDMIKDCIKDSDKEIYISGGEPFLNPEIINILEELKRLNKKVVVFCNGFTLSKFDNRNFEKILTNIDRLIISFDGFKDDYLIRTVKASEIIKAIEKVIKYKVDLLEVKISINNYNIDYFNDTVDNLLEMGVKRLSINLVHNLDSVEKNFEVIQKDKLIAVIDRIIKMENIFDINYIKNIKQFLDGNMKILAENCSAGKEFKFINCKGEKFVCPIKLTKNLCDKNSCISKKCINLWEMY